MNRIEVITRSLRCFTLSLVGLVPLLGIAASVMAVIQFWQVIMGKPEDWNPARRYLAWGFFLGAFSLLAHFTAAIILTIAIMNQVLQ